MSEDITVDVINPEKSHICRVEPNCWQLILMSADSEEGETETLNYECDGCLREITYTKGEAIK